MARWPETLVVLGVTGNARSVTGSTAPFGGVALPAKRSLRFFAWNKVGRSTPVWLRTTCVDTRPGKMWLHLMQERDRRGTRALRRFAYSFHARGNELRVGDRHDRTHGASF